jgi:hypothetical protein
MASHVASPAALVITAKSVVIDPAVTKNFGAIDGETRQNELTVTH